MFAVGEARCLPSFSSRRIVRFRIGHCRLCRRTFRLPCKRRFRQLGEIADECSFSVSAVVLCKPGGLGVVHGMRDTDDIETISRADGESARRGRHAAVATRRAGVCEKTAHLRNAVLRAALSDSPETPCQGAQLQLRSPTG